MKFERQCSVCKRKIKSELKTVMCCNKPMGAPTVTDRPLLPIPIEAAKAIAMKYGYDQVVVYARRVGEHPNPSGEHMTTYGTDRTHCDVAALMGNTIKRVAQWPSKQDAEDLSDLYDDLVSGVFDYADYEGSVRRIGALRRLLGK